MDTPRRSPVLGVLSLIILVVALILVSMVAYGLASIATGTPVFGLSEVRPLFLGPGAGSVLAGLIGTIVAIIAIATGRGRVFGVIALVLVPLSWIVAFLGAFVGYMTG